MRLKNKQQKLSALFAGLIFTIIGTYNSVVINSESAIHGTDIKFVKRLDQMYGITTPARNFAATTTWQKLESPKRIEVQQMQAQKVLQTVTTTQSSVTEELKPVAEAAIQEELSLNLIEVINPNKYKNGLSVNDFSGSLSTSNGQIESLDINLPEDQSVSVSFAEMNGNVFEYEMNGEVYSGLLFQVDQYNYMVTLTNGPLEGTRLKFNSPNSDEVVTGTFGAESPAPETMMDEANGTNTEMVNSGFNFDSNI